MDNLYKSFCRASWDFSGRNVRRSQRFCPEINTKDSESLEDHQIILSEAKQPGSWAAGLPGSWASGKLGSGVAGQLGSRVAGKLGSQVDVQLGSWAARQSGSWAAGQLGSRVAGQQVNMETPDEWGAPARTGTSHAHLYNTMCNPAASVPITSLMSRPTIKLKWIQGQNFVWVFETLVLNLCDQGLIRQGVKIHG
jgi:hypothetical protein